MSQFPRALSLAPALLTLSLALSACSGGTPSTPVAEAPPAPPVAADPAPTPVAGPDRLVVSADGRRLEYADGRPFLYWADTAWELFHRPNRDDARLYLQTRAAQGFTVVQAAALAEESGLTVPNAQGDLPLTDKDPARPAVTPGNDPGDAEQYDYWDHVDYIVDQAASLGLTVALLPSWGIWVNNEPRLGDEPVFTPDSARSYGRFIGERYKDKPVIWVLGGDRYPDTEEVRAIWRAMAQGIEQGAGGGDRALSTYHTRGYQTSSKYFHNEAWLDFNLWHTGHCRNEQSATRILEDYRLTPAKPVVNFEPMYEGHPVCHNPPDGNGDEVDVRNVAYWSVFAGAAGHTYGHRKVYGFDVYDGDKAWQRALDTAAVRHLGHLKALLESRPARDRAPDETLVAGSFVGDRPVVAMRGPDYVWLYLPDGGPVTVTLGRAGGAQVRASWFDPRTGGRAEIGTFANTGERTFTASSAGRGHDWVLLLEASR
ncbi:glycoside hydrolase family 140 protein [Deinococcus aestuarii]|uniref:glycoside hydrolase family 140 protein n=1 Tax=Deinococcus aestuarii TaxID=2774531 RepID=UPI001C0BD0F0|nr:glycoside hydrolase family 140 protein [Deinococcus aestuarii]